MTEGVCIMASMKEDRGDLTKRVEELDNSLSIALDTNDKYQRENKKRNLAYCSCKVIQLFCLKAVLNNYAKFGNTTKFIKKR